MRPVIALGSLYHESNSFVPARTGVQDFIDYAYSPADRLIEDYAGTGTELGGALAACDAAAARPVPLIAASAVPSGPVEAEAFDLLSGRLLSELESALPVDAVVLALHGALAVEASDDAEATLVAGVRNLVGDAPIAVTLDFHANVGPALCSPVDAVVAYQTYPHTDMAACGQRAVRLLLRMLAGEGRPRVQLEKLPLLTVPQVQETEDDPMRFVIEAMRQLNGAARIWTAGAAGGYPYCDVPRLGLALYAVAEVDVGVPLREVGDAIWRRRAEFEPELYGVEEALELASRSDPPVVLVDVADNVGGGSPGDGTVLLDALQRRGGGDAIVVIWDPAAIEEIYSGRAARLAVDVGGRSSVRLGSPVRVSGRVERPGQIAYRRTSRYMRGQRVELGRVAVIRADAGSVVVTERRAMPFDDDHLRVLGLRPERARILVAKAAIAWKEAFARYARTTLYVDTPGFCPSNLTELQFQRRPRPIYPLERSTPWPPDDLDSSNGRN